ILALYLQDGRSLSPLGSSLIFLALGPSYFAASITAPKLAVRMGRKLLATGSVVYAAGCLVLTVSAISLGSSGAIEWLVPGLLVSGWGMGTVFAVMPGVIL